MEPENLLLSISILWAWADIPEGNSPRLLFDRIPFKLCDLGLRELFILSLKGRAWWGSVSKWPSDANPVL